jgi:hypothetical protein
MSYSSPTRPLQTQQSQQSNQTIWNPIPRRFPTLLPLSPSTKHKNTLSSPLQPSFHPIMQVHQHPVTHNPFAMTDGLACLHCQQIPYPDTIHAPITMTARKRPPTHHPEPNSSCTDELCSRIPHPPTTSQHKISWFTHLTQYFTNTSPKTQTQTQPAILTHLPQTFHSVFLPENNTKYPSVPLNPADASPFFPLKEPFHKCPTNPKYHP